MDIVLHRICTFYQSVYLWPEAKQKTRLGKYKKKNNVAEAVTRFKRANPIKSSATFADKDSTEGPGLELHLDNTVYHKRINNGSLILSWIILSQISKWSEIFRHECANSSSNSVIDMLRLPGNRRDPGAQGWRAATTTTTNYMQSNQVHECLTVKIYVDTHWSFY